MSWSRIWGTEVQLQSFFTLELEGNEWLLSWAGHFSLKETAHIYIE